jgi:hypothetical protein
MMPTTRPAQPRFQPLIAAPLRLCWGAVLLLTIALYFPGLSGSYEFDDFPNIVDNDALHVTTLDRSAWISALWASPASDLQRPLSSLTFAVNHYFTGLAPRPMKITNLAIHLLNGCLLFVLLRRMLALGRRSALADDSIYAGDWLALAVAALWLIHPISLTAVLFVVQRMESLAQTFVLLGLLCYVDARARQQASMRGAFSRLWIAFPLCVVLGVACKESAVLLPLYALVLEATILRDCRRRRRELEAFYLIFLVIPGAIGLAWIVPHAFGADAYAERPFTMAQRLLTEPRVLLDYIVWILLPLPQFFSFFRDDFEFSTDALHPWSTIPAILAVLALLIAALRLRQREPVVSLGLLWFFCAHALTSTILPLELVFEHRNYFASIGVLLAAARLVMPLGKPAVRLRFARSMLVGGLGGLCAFSLALRAREWSDPVILAVTEAAQHPRSPRATYELGRTYVILSGYRADSPNTERAVHALETAMRTPRASILPEVALIMLASRTGKPIDATWWTSMHDKLGHRAPTIEDASAIESLTMCQREGRCALDDARMLDIYLTAANHEQPDPKVLNSYAIFAFNRLHDGELALQLARDAAMSRDPQYTINLAGFLIDLGDIDGARVEVDRLRSRNRLGKLTAQIAAIDQRIANAPHEHAARPQ